VDARFTRSATPCRGRATWGERRPRTQRPCHLGGHLVPTASHAVGADGV